MRPTLTAFVCFIGSAAIAIAPRSASTVAARAAQAPGSVRGAAAAPVVISPEIGSDRRVTFRILATGLRGERRGSHLAQLAPEKTTD